MKRFTLPILISVLTVVAILTRCKPDPTPDKPKAVGTPYNFVTPKGFPQPNIPADNPMTVEGVDLGHHLFFEKRLSGDLSMSCAGCHNQVFFFADFPENALSTGITGMEGKRNAMVLFNLAWQEFFFWDGRALSLEEQSMHPIKDPVELNTDLATVVKRLEADTVYPNMFKAAFGDPTINADRIAKALAQFERTIISSNSEFDRVKRLSGNLDNPFYDDPNEPGDPNKGFEMFNTDVTTSGIRGGDCFHCHGIQETSYLLAAFGQEENQFKNNGFKENFVEDIGREGVTNDPNDKGKFKVPSVRNMEWSFPYMHDGSLAPVGSGGDPVMQLVEFYNSGIHSNSPNLDPNMTKFGSPDKNWTQAQKEDLKAFLLTLTDDSLRFDPAFENPFEQ